MLKKIFAIAYTGLYITYTDRIALLYMFLAPLAISTIMGMVFGGGTEDISLPESDVILINLDEGTSQFGQEFNFGEQYIEVLVDNPSVELADLIHAETGEDRNAARQKVEDGDLRAVLTIPADFSARVLNADEQGEVDLYYNPSSEIGATIVVSVIESITSGINSSVVAQNLYAGGMDGYFIDFSQDASQLNAAIGRAIQQITSNESLVSLQDVNVEGEDEAVNLLSYFAPAMAILFLTFAMAAGTRAILQEQVDWTLQRIMTTPTPRWVYLAGRLLGNYGTGLLQMLILFIVTPVVSSLVGAGADVWGTNLLGISLIVLSVIWAATGLGLLLAAVARTAEQADILATAVLFIMAMLGGSFVQVDQVPFLNTVSRFTLNYWGIDGIFRLATEDARVADILTNVAALLGMGALFFVGALWRFNKRLDF